MTPGLLAHDYVDPRDLTGTSSVRDFAVAYLQELRDKGRSETTLPKYEQYLEELCVFLDRDARSAKVRDLDVRTLRAYSSQLSRRTVRNGRYGGKRTISAATKNLHLIAIRGLLKFGVLLDLPVTGPEKIELAKASEPNPDARHLATERLTRLIEAFDTATDQGVRGRALLELLLATGCRISEVINLDRRAVELPKAGPDGIRVVDEVTVLGKGNRHRRVYIALRAREWLHRYLALRKDTDPALFITGKKSGDGSLRMTVRTAENVVKEAALRAGLAEVVSPHWLRHAAITFWAAEISLPAAQRLAGHQQISSTNRYLGGSDAELKALYKKHVG